MANKQALPIMENNETLSKIDEAAMNDQETVVMFSDSEYFILCNFLFHKFSVKKTLLKALFDHCVTSCLLR